MKHIGQAIEVSEYEAVCARMTGKTVEECEAVWRARRMYALRDQKLTGFKRYSLREREAVMRYYDLDAEDFADVEAGTNGALQFRIRQSTLRRIAEETR